MNWIWCSCTRICILFKFYLNFFNLNQIKKSDYFTTLLISYYAVACSLIFLLYLSQYIMANGALVRVLIHTDVTKYLYFKAVDGSFVYNKGKVFVWCYVFLCSFWNMFIHTFFWFCFSSPDLLVYTELCCKFNAIDSQGACNWYGGSQIPPHGYLWKETCPEVFHLCPRLQWKWSQNTWRNGFDKSDY